MPGNQVRGVLKMERRPWPGVLGHRPNMAHASVRDQCATGARWAPARDKPGPIERCDATRVLIRKQRWGPGL